MGNMQWEMENLFLMYDIVVSLFLLLLLFLVEFLGYFL